MSDIKQFLREFNEYWVQEDVPAIVNSVTDDIRFGMAGDKMISGKADFEQFLNTMPSGGSDMALTITSIIVEDDRAAVDGEISMTDKEGQRKTYAFCDVYRLAGGKVAELIAYVLEIKQDDKG